MARSSRGSRPAPRPAAPPQSRSASTATHPQHAAGAAPAAHAPPPAAAASGGGSFLGNVSASISWEFGREGGDRGGRAHDEQSRSVVGGRKGSPPSSLARPCLSPTPPLLSRDEPVRNADAFCSIFSKIASTAAGVAVGSTVGHGLSSMSVLVPPPPALLLSSLLPTLTRNYFRLFGGSSSAAAPVSELPPQQAYAAANEIKDQGASCAIQAKVRLPVSIHLHPDRRGCLHLSAWPWDQSSLAFSREAESTLASSMKQG